MSRRFAPPDRDRRELEVLHRLALTLPRSLTVTGVTDELAKELTMAVARADECTISSWEPLHDRLVILSTHDRAGGIDEQWRNHCYPLTDWPENRALLEAGADHRQFRSDDAQFDAIRARLQEWGWKSWIALPLLVENRSVGLIELVDYDSSREWSRRDIAFCQTIAGQAALVVRNAQLYEDARQQVDRDPLTGLLNHRAFHQRLDRELARHRESAAPLSVMALDLDDFKLINDRNGHIAGDSTLRRVADLLRETCGERGAAGRLGGDEFALLLPGVVEDAALVARRIHAQLAAQTHVSASIGIARCRVDDRDPVAVLDRADQALLVAKRSGKQTFRLSA